MDKNFSISTPSSSKKIILFKKSNIEYTLVCFLNMEINKIAIECSNVELYTLYNILRDEYQLINDPPQEYWEIERAFNITLNDVSSLDGLVLIYNNKELFTLYKLLEKEF